MERGAWRGAKRTRVPDPRPDASRAQIETAARLSGAHDFILELPEGYETLLGERGYSLSGGQRQRIALARAIVADPRVLILDDATSAVDPSKEHEIREAMQTVMQGRTTIVIAHRPGTIALADRVVLLDDGHGAEQVVCIIDPREPDRWPIIEGVRLAQPETSAPARSRGSARSRFRRRGIARRGNFIF